MQDSSTEHKYMFTYVYEPKRKKKYKDMEGQSFRLLTSLMIWTEIKYT